MLPNQPTKPIKRAGSKRRRSSTLKGLVDGKIPVLGNRNEVSSIHVHKILPPRDFSIMTLITAIIELTEFNRTRTATEMDGTLHNDL